MTLLFEEDLDEAETLSVFCSSCSTSVGTAGSSVGALISDTVVGLSLLFCALALALA